MTTAALPSSMGAQMGMAQSQHAAQDVQDKSRAIDSLKRDLNQPKDKAKKLREACEGFESVFIQKMWEQMRATVPKGGMLQGRDEQYWQGMFDQELSKKMSSAGGIGLADMMYEQLSRNLVSASRTTASAIGTGGSAAPTTSGFVASAAPLLPPTGQATPANATPNNANAAGPQAGIYGQEAAQPEAATPTSAQANSQSTDSAAGIGAKQAGPITAQANGTPAPAASTDAPPEVQQVLDQLRAQSAMGTTMTGAQAIAAVQAMTPAQAQALSQGMSWSQVQAMHPTTTGLAAAAGVSPEMLGQTTAAMQGQTAPSGLDTSRAALQSANTRIPAGGVLPPMTPMQRQARVNYSAAKVQGNGISAQVHSPVTQPAAPAVPHAAAQQSTMPVNPTLSSNVQGSPGVSPTKFVQNSALIPNQPIQAPPTQSMAGQVAGQAAGATPAPSGMTGEQIAALTGQAQTLTQNTALQAQAMGQSMGATPTAGMATGAAGNGQQGNAAIPPTAQEPQIINTTFTTNVPPSRRNSRQGQRVPKGQPAIRSLNTGGQS